MRTFRWRRGARLAACAVLLASASPSPVGGCVGDCNVDGRVRVDELVMCVDIGLGNRPIRHCSMLDEDENEEISIAEIIGAVTSSLGGCPGTPTPTSTATPTSTPTPTATVNLPPLLPSPPIYRTYPDFSVAFPLFLDDPNGDQVTCSSEALPNGATISEVGVLHWTPTSDQLGPFYVPYRCSDDANSSDGELILKVQPRDSCVVPTCDPASGCTDSLPPLDQACCSAEPTERVAEPQADCPAARVVFAGGNLETGFGRLQNCDKLRMLVQQQAGASVRLNFETRCMNPNNRVTIRARLETSSPTRPLAFDFQANLFPTPGKDGFQHYPQLASAIDGNGPFFDLEDGEANLIITATDLPDRNVATTTIRVILTSTPQPDLPDLEATPVPEATDE